MNSSVPPRTAALLDFIGAKESGGNYRAYYAHATNTSPLPATLAGVLRFQSDLVHVRQMASSAMGRYQFMPDTLKGLMAQMRLGGDTPFTNDLQDALAFQLLENRGYEAWSAGRESDEAFADSLSKEWASLPYHTGRSFYAGDGLNASRVARHSFLAALAEAKKLPAKPGPARVARAPAAPTPSPSPSPSPSPAPTPGGPPSAPASGQPTAQERAPMQKDILAGLLKTVSGVVLGASEYASVVPNLVGGAIKSVDDGKKAAGDVQAIIRDVESGKWGEVVSDIGPVVGDAVKILGNFGVRVPLLGDVASKMSSLPSVAGLKAASAS